MIWPIVFGVLGFGLAALFVAYEIRHSYAPDLSDWAFFFPMMTLFFGAVISAVFLAAAEGIAYPFDHVSYDTRTYGLSTLADTPSTSGEFFLGTGEVNGNLTASFYVKHDGYTEPQSVNDYDDRIRVYQDSDKPYVVEAYPESAHFWAGSLFTGANTSPLITFHVPPGTVKSNYTLDAR